MSRRHLVTMAVVWGGLLAALPATAQWDPLPRIGLSASPDSYVDSLSTDLGKVVTVYVCMFGVDDKTPLQESISSVPWVIHQVCCGAAMEILNTQYNPDMDHVGHPLAGVRSSARTCMQGSSVLLATVQARITAEQPGDFYWASGLADAFTDCGGAHPQFQGLGILISAKGDQVPDDRTGWGTLKALYR